MLNVPVFKAHHAVYLCIGLVIFGIIYKVAFFSPLDQVIISKTPVNNLANLYITESSIGATTDFSYRFYLNASNVTDKDFKSKLNNKVPFLITSDKTALNKVDNGIIYLNITGKVYSFNNSPAYTYNDNIYSVDVNLIATP